MISASPGRDLCGWPPDHPDTFNREMRRGSLLSAMIAHADVDAVYSMRHEGRPVVYARSHARAALAEGPPVAPVVILACYCGSFTRPDPCLAEELFGLPGGPVAVIAATTESHPLTNYFSGVALLKTLGEVRRVGDFWLAAQTRAKKERNFLVEKALEGAEGSLEPEIDVGKLRRDQALMYALLGDPATPLKCPDPLDVEITRTEEGWRFEVARPERAVRLSIARRPLSPPKKKGKRARPPASPEEARKRFELANAEGKFLPLAEVSGNAPWAGDVQEGGWLRFVATGPGVFRAGRSLQFGIGRRMGREGTRACRA